MLTSFCFNLYVIMLHKKHDHQHLDVINTIDKISLAVNAISKFCNFSDWFCKIIAKTSDCQYAHDSPMLYRNGVKMIECVCMCIHACKCMCCMFLHMYVCTTMIFKQGTENMISEWCSFASITSSLSS